MNHYYKFYFSILFIMNLLFGNNLEIGSYKYNDMHYFEISEFCDIKNYKYIYYEDKSKVAILLNDQKFTFSNNSSFVQVDQQTVHMLNNMLINQDKFYLPVNSFNILAEYFSIPTLSYNNNNTFSIIEKQELAINNTQELQDTISYDLFAKHFDNNRSINTIVIDAGHGGKDPGAIGYYNIKEKNIVLDISNKVGSFIEKNFPNIKVIYTRKDDTFLGLRDRTNIANENQGQLFISIHANASTAKSARGFEIFLLGTNSADEAREVTIRENASIAFEENQEQYNTENQIIAGLSQIAFFKESEKLAVFIQNSVKKELPKTRNRGIKQAGFHVLVGASMPNLLVEVGFITNKSEAQLLNRSSYRKQMAYGIYQGIANYIQYYEKKYID